MTRLLISISLFVAGLTSFAQGQVIGVREANNPSGKILTMEETILARELSPENLYCTWVSPYTDWKLILSK